MRLAWTLGALGLILFVSWWGLDSWLEPRALAVWESESYKTEAKGWGVVTTAWPLLVSFGLALAIFFMVIIGTLLEFAKEADFKAEIKKLRERVDKSEKNAQGAREELITAQSKADAIAEKNYSRLIESIQEREINANEMVINAQEEKRKAEQRAQELEEQTKKSKHQKTKAMAYNERKRRKQAELRAKFESGNVDYEDIRKALN